MEVCTACQGITPYSLTVETEDQLPSGIEFMRSGYQHSPDFEDLKTSAKNCPMCQLLLDTLNGEKFKTHRKEHAVILSADTLPSDQLIPRDVAGMVATVQNSDWRAYFHVYADPAISGDVCGRPIATDPASQKAFDTIRSWIVNCRDNHHECNYDGQVSVINERRRYPSRLLDLGSSQVEEEWQTCFLVDVGQVYDQYATLSYCWGLSQPLRTLKSNVETHKQRGILVEDMPQTLQDAVFATRKLKIRYLWIDALCIVQDDLIEWELEAPHMGDIYRNSYCTIAATGSVSSAAGMFIPRQQSASAIKLLYRSPVAKGQQQLTSHFFIKPVKSNFLSGVERTVWNTRGWVLQERLLSRRIIHFSSGQTFFECQRQSVGEDGRNLSLYQLKRFSTGTIPQGEDWGWCLMIENYTERNLTQNSDKLFAVAGLASAMAVRTKKSYCAGLWCENMQLHMLWYSKVGKMQRPKKQRAPTWSWAAWDGAVMWEPFMSDAVSFCTLLVPKRYHGILTNPLDVYIEFSGTLVSVGRSDDTIASGGGDSSNLAQALLYLIDVDTHSSCYALVAYNGLQLSNRQIGWATFDEGSAQQGPFIAALISQNNTENDRKRTTCNVLIIKEIPKHEGHFERVGMGEINEPTIFSPRSKSNIRIY